MEYVCPTCTRMCPCGKPAANRNGVPRCADCVLEKKRRYQREYKARKSKDHRKRKDLPQRGDLATAICGWCETEFSYTYTNQPRRSCDDCQKRSGQARIREWGKNHQGQRRVFAKRYNATPEGRAGTARRNGERRFIKFGVDRSWFEAQLAAQDGRCAICGTTDPGGRTGAWHIDHDRSCCEEPPCCGQCVRGILCAKCNVGLGQFDDDPQRLRQAAACLAGFGRMAIKPRQLSPFDPAAGRVQGFVPFSAQFQKECAALLAGLQAP